MQELVRDITLQALEAKNSQQFIPDAEQSELIADIKRLLIEKDAVLVAHYYVGDVLQQLAEETGGHVADSLDMAAFGQNHSAKKLLVCGVRFMGETAKILTPWKRVFMPDLRAECSLDLGCPVEAFVAFKQAHPDRVSVVYANTSAAVKAEADWVVTSSNAVAIVNHLKRAGKKILWVPDRHLGRWVQEQTKADMVCWQGHCVVHDEFRMQALLDLMAEYPEALVLAHPESPDAVLRLATVVGSTKVLVKAVSQISASQFIIATDAGIFYKMQQMQPNKQFFLAPTGGKGATCQACGRCPWMGLNDLRRLRDCLLYERGEVLIEESVRQRAVVPIERMMRFSAQKSIPVAGDA